MHLKKMAEVLGTVLHAEGGYFEVMVASRPKVFDQMTAAVPEIM
jgi:hypothetical protein